MTLTARQLNLATLDRQLLLRREPLSVRDAVRRLAGLQAQQAASPYLALWNRLSAFDPADLDAAFTDRAIVKATLMRITLHAVHAEDYPVFHSAMLPCLRGVRLGDRRFTSSGLTIADADALVPHLVEFTTQPRTGAEIEAMLASRLGDRRQGVWWALRTFAPLTHAPAGGPWSFGSRPSFVAAGAQLPVDRRDESVRHLVRRYLAAFGPASVPDVAQFTLLPRAVVRDAVRALAEEVEEMAGPEGTTLLDVAGARIPDEDTPRPPRLLPMWDNVLLAYFDRSRVIPPDYRPLVARRNGDVLPTLLVDGHVAGVWRPVGSGVEATAFHPLPDQTWTALEAEAAALTALLADRDTAVYGRYAHWWDSLPSAEVRFLPG